jgi:hypothetical protein
MSDDNNKDKKRENSTFQEWPSAEVTSATEDTTNVGNKDKKILDTGDISEQALPKE